MGCCSSVPENEAKSSQQQQQQQGTSNNKNDNKRSSGIENPELTLTRPSTSSLNLDNGEKKEDNKKKNNKKTWPIFVRLSHNGQDIKIEAPIESPYLTIASLRQQLTPHLNNYNNSKNSVKLIYLGRILSSRQTIVPTVTDEDMPLPPPKNNTIQIQKNGVIQAMVSKA